MTTARLTSACSKVKRCGNVEHSSSALQGSEQKERRFLWKRDSLQSESEVRGPQVQVWRRSLDPGRIGEDTALTRGQLHHEVLEVSLCNQLAEPSIGFAEAFVGEWKRALMNGDEQAGSQVLEGVESIERAEMALAKGAGPVSTNWQQSEVRPVAFANIAEARAVAAPPTGKQRWTVASDYKPKPCGSIALYGGGVDVDAGLRKTLFGRKGEYLVKSKLVERPGGARRDDDRGRAR